MLVKVEIGGVGMSDMAKYLDTLNETIKNENPFPRRIAWIHKGYS